jgi:hypothetical protein
MNATERYDTLDLAIAEGRLIRKEWTRDEDGRHLACLLSALSPEASNAKTAAACPAWLLPSWFARLVPWMDDAGSEEAWPGMVRRFALLVRRSAALTAEDWQRLDFACRAVALREARSHVQRDEWGVLTALDRALGLCEQAASGVSVADAEWTKESAAARAAAEAAAAAAAAWAAAAAAWAAAWAAGAAAAAGMAGADRITTGILDALEAAIAAREAA